MRMHLYERQGFDWVTVYELKIDYVVNKDNIHTVLVDKQRVCMITVR